MRVKTYSFFKIIILSTLVSASVYAQDEEISFEAADAPYHPAPPPVYKGAVYDEHALYGFSVGALMMSQTYIQINTTYDPSNPNKPADKKAQDLDSYQSMGAFARYSMLPIDHFGTDVNISYVSSINHDSVKKSALAITKGEINLGYAWGLNKNFKIYVLLGAGVQYVTGQDIELLIQRMGYGGQTGVGLSITRINIEMLANYYRNRISDDVNKNTATATSALDTDHTYVDAQGIVGRISYNF